MESFPAPQPWRRSRGDGPHPALNPKRVSPAGRLTLVLHLEDVPIGPPVSSASTSDPVGPGFHPASPPSWCLDGPLPTLLPRGNWAIIPLPPSLISKLKEHGEHLTTGTDLLGVCDLGQVTWPL